MCASDDFLERETEEEDREDKAEQRTVNLDAIFLIALTCVLMIVGYIVGYNVFVYMGWIGHN